MLSSVKLFKVDWDRVLLAGVSFAVIYFAYYNLLGRGVSIMVSLQRGIEFAVCQIISELIFKNVVISSLSWVSEIKNTIGVDLFAALLMALWTSYSIDGTPFSFGRIPVPFIMALGADMLATWIEPIVNHPMLVGEGESRAIQIKIADQKKPGPSDNSDLLVSDMAVKSRKGF